MDLWLGLDIGGTYTKAALYDERLNEHAIARKAGRIDSPKPGWVERDMESLWLDTAAVIADVLAKGKVYPGQIRGIAISGQGKGAYLLNEAKKAFAPGILSSDQRAMELTDRLNSDGTKEKLYAISRQNLWTGHPAMILRWLKDNAPEVYRRARHVVMVHDYVRYRLTGELGCEITNISESNLFNQFESRYDGRLAGLLDIPEAMDLLPPIVGSCAMAGAITEDAAAATGLAKGTPVAGGLFDVVATAMCAGIVDEEVLCAVMGTWAIVSGVTGEILNHDTGFSYAYGHHAQNGLYLTCDASPTSAGNLEWFLGLFGDVGGLDYERLNREVGELGKNDPELFFLPFLNGSNAGLGMRGGFYGLQALHGKRHLVKAIYDGTVFSLNVHAERMRRRLPKVKLLRATGGAARSRVWMQVLSDVTGLPVEITRFEETGCLGAALTAMVMSGVHPDIIAAVKSLPSATARIQPDSEAFQPYQEKYRRYHELIDALRGFAGIVP